jgi:hypothetical protein
MWRARRNVAPHTSTGLSRRFKFRARCEFGAPAIGKALSAPAGVGQPQARLNLPLAATQSPLLIIAKPMPLQAFAPGPGDLPPCKRFGPYRRSRHEERFPTYLKKASTTNTLKPLNTEAYARH